MTDHPPFSLPWTAEMLGRAEVLLTQVANAPLVRIAETMVWLDSELFRSELLDSIRTWVDEMHTVYRLAQSEQLQAAFNKHIMYQLLVPDCRDGNHRPHASGICPCICHRLQPVTTMPEISIRRNGAEETGLDLAAIWEDWRTVTMRGPELGGPACRRLLAAVPDLLDLVERQR